MTARRLLLLDAKHLTAFRWQPGGPREEAGFAADEAGRAAFGEYLRRQRSSLFYLLADVVDEGFQVETVPYLRGSDRRELIGRKLGQLFYGSPLSLAMSLGRLKEGRRDEKLLFAGLTGYAQIEPWLAALHQAEAQLVGIYSQPQMVAELLGKADGDGRMLAISISRSGLRQTFFDQGRLRFSRLTPLTARKIEDFAAACATETHKIHRYLAAQRLIADDLPLRTLVLAHPGQFHVFAEQCPNTPERQVELIDLVALGKKHGLVSPPPDSNGELLFLQLLAKRTPPLQFAPPAERRQYRLWQARFGVRALAAGAMAASVLFAGAQALRLQALDAGNAQAQADIELGKRRYEAMLAGLPKIPVSTDELRALTDRDELLSRRTVGPEPLLRHISRALDKLPRIDLTRIDWQIANSADDDAGAVKTAVPGKVAGNFAVALVQAQLPLAMAGDHRDQLATIDAFTAALQGDDTQVKVISLPFETESGKAIKSGEAKQAEPPQFTLRVVRKL
jgi:hypothetical protein